MTYFDIFFLLKYFVLGGVLVAVSLSVALLIRNLGARLSSSQSASLPVSEAESAVETIVEASSETVVDTVEAKASVTPISDTAEEQVAIDVPPAVDTEGSVEHVHVEEQTIDAPLQAKEVVQSIPEFHPEAVMEQPSEHAPTAQEGGAYAAAFTAQSMASHWVYPQSNNQLPSETGIQHQAENRQLPFEASYPSRPQQLSIADLLRQLEHVESLYQVSSGLLSPQERSAYRALQAAMPDGALMMCKVRVADVLASRVTRTAEHFELLKLVSTQYFAFVVCDARTLMPLGFVELYGYAGDEVGTRSRLEVLQHISAEAQFPMLVVNVAGEFPAQQVRHALGGLTNDEVESELYAYATLEQQPVPAQVYNPVEAEVNANQVCVQTHEHGYSYTQNAANSGAELAETQAQPLMQHQATAQSAQIQPTMAQQPGSTCPACGSTMRYRISRDGKLKGRVFHVCESYPHDCSHIRILPEMAEFDVHPADLKIAVAARQRQFA